MNESFDETILNSIDKFCFKPYLETDCKITIYKVINDKILMRNYYKNDSRRWKINIFSKSSLIIEYQQKYRMDWLELLYNFGGTIALWFGWSALSITSIFILFKQISIKLFNKCLTIFLKLFDYFYKWKFIRNRIAPGSKNEEQSGISLQSNKPFSRSNHLNRSDIELIEIID